MNCTVCDKEIMAGKRCIECFISKKKKRPEIKELPPSTVYPVSGPIEIGEVRESPGYPFNTIPEQNGDISITATSHTMTSVDSIENGQNFRRYKVTYPSLDWGSTQEGEKI